MVVCDGIKQSSIEAHVFDLKGARQSVRSVSFPYRPSRLWLLLILSSRRTGRFPGSVQIIEDQTDRVVFMAHMKPDPEFHGDDEYSPVRMRLPCWFPRPGRYFIQVWFFQANSADVIKGEKPFDVQGEGL